MKTSITVVIVWAIILLFGLIFVSPRAQAQGGIPLWTNFYNGPTNTYSLAKAVAVDGSGNVFVTGYSVIGNGSDLDYVTIKYSNAGVPLWTNRYAGSADGWDEPCCIAVDSSGDVIVTGLSDHSGYDSSHTNFDYATIKYSNAGVPLWTNRYNGPANGGDGASAIAVDASGNVFVTGDSTGDCTGSDYATIKYSNVGVPLWTNRYDGPASAADGAIAIAVDSSGNVFVTGISDSPDIDYATIKYSNAGALLWVARYQGLARGLDIANSVKVDGNGNVIVTGSSERSDLDGTIHSDYVTIKYSNAGATLWEKRFALPTRDNAYARSLAVASNGKVFVTGYVEDTSGSGARVFATVAYSSSGVPLWTNLFNGPGSNDSEPRVIAVDSSGNVFVTGYSTSTDTNLSTDAATIAYSPAGVPLWSHLYRGPINYWDQADAVAVDGNGNVFIAASSGINGPYPDYYPDYDFVTIKYSSMSPQPVHLTIERDGGHGYFIRVYGHPGSTYRLQRALSVKGPWSNLATNTAPASGLIEYHETNPPAGAGFYRTFQP